MIQNYFIIAWRSLNRKKYYSILNIGGLAIGLTCLLLIFLYVRHENKYDRFYANSDQVYRMYIHMPGLMHLGTDYFAMTPVRLAASLVEEVPGIKHATSILEQEALLSFQEQNLLEQGLWADPHFFKVFEYPLIQGNPQTVLSNPYSIVLTESLSQKLFHGADPMGKTILFQNDTTYTVSGIMPDLPETSSLTYSFVTSILSMGNYLVEKRKETWDNNMCHTFFVKENKVELARIEEQMFVLSEKYQNKDFPFETKYLAQALSELHLQGKVNNDIGRKGNAQYLYILSLIGLVVLLLACVNYVNLAIARSIDRVREVGMRKVIGAKRGQIIQQFLSESILVALLAFLLATGLTYLFLPTFGSFLDRSLSFNLLDSVFLLPGLLIGVIGIGIIAGGYPAFYISALRPVWALKGKSGKKQGKLYIQRSLITLQYVLSIVLMISSFVIYKQFQFIQKKELGYNKEHILNMPVRDFSLFNQFSAIKGEWLSNPNVLYVSSASQLPTHITSSTVINDDDANEQNDLSIYEARVDYDYIDLFGIELLEGRNFSANFGQDAESGYILNETAALALGWTPEEAIGKQFSHEGMETVIGVVKDFHMHSLHAPILPLMIRLKDQLNVNISVKLQGENISETLSFLEKSLKKYTPYTFEYSFLDKEYDRLYKTEVQTAKMFAFFTMISILIASLGLFGLSAFLAEQRKKEIGIRKVLGASIQDVLFGFSKGFMSMVLLGFILAIPIAYYAMSAWLADYAFRIELNWWMFALSGIVAFMIAFLTISSQAIKAASERPVHALRDE